MDIQGELKTLRDLANETEYDMAYHPSTHPQLGRISEVLRRVYGIKLPRLIRVRAIAELLDYDYKHFRTSEQLSIKGAGAIISWAFVPHEENADLDTVPLREAASAMLHWAISAASDKTTLAELIADEEAQKAKRRAASKQRCARNRREAAPLHHQS
jgi:hypothetical protein